VRHDDGAASAYSGAWTTGVLGRGSEWKAGGATVVVVGRLVRTQGATEYDGGSRRRPGGAR
jgi:hypothetical protein